jgi:hypothetical protein
MNELGVTINLVYEDPRYPTLVLESEHFNPLGYSLDLDTGRLSRVCICHAHESTECVCGAWDQ